MQLLDILLAPWAIEPASLREIQAIYATHLRGEKIDLEAVEARLGRPLANEQQEYRIEAGGVAVLPIEGVLAPKANMFMRISGGASTQMLQKQIESAMADPRVRSLVLAVDSPGGSVHGGPELAAFIREASGEKPIVAVSDRMMASMAYWIGSAANAVYVSGPTVQVGSIGVVATHNYDPRAAQGTTEITAGKYKRIASENAPLTTEGRAYMQAQVDHLYTVFVNAVADYRGAEAATVLEHMADGRVFIGQQAIDAGLVDGVSTVDAIVEQLAADPSAFSTRRKARVAGVAPTPTPGAGAALPSKPATEGASMPITRAQLEAEAPDLLKSIQAEGHAAGVVAGAAAECARIKDVLAQAIPGHEAVVQALAFDGKSTAGDAAQAVLAAERKVRVDAAAALAKDAPPAVPAAPSGTVRAPEGHGLTRADVDRKAKEYMAANKGVDYIAAVRHIESTMQGA